DDTFIRQAAKELGVDYEARLKDYSPLPLIGKDARTGETLDNPLLVAQIWVAGEPKVRAYRTPQSAFLALAELEKEGKKVRVTYVQDRKTGLKLFADKAWYVRESDGSLAAFLLEETAAAWAKEKGGAAQNFAQAKVAAPAQVQASK
ncbi:nitrous oxide reductase accessory protein NosL, partial [Bradyrhizobium sp. NBAIM08]|uniref:nitrous oxide reductase accessory protein NosL n=1 Tax=Bradyrhizobium sp. NBAIM08 TaxID=2793815 RepID=UPI0034D35980|nr:nitrate ABC transporter substrate-binding protein [Bradyrhizobium sp. NBAIM08]